MSKPWQSPIPRNPIPGMGALPSTRNQPYNLFRYGEQVISAKTIFAPGVTLGDNMPGAWEWHVPPEDLQGMLWSAYLEWDFLHTTAGISHLNFSTGSIGDFFFPSDDGRTDMEKLADTIKEGKLPPEEVWRALAQATTIGQGVCFRGKKVYQRFPVALPANTTCSLRLCVEEPFTPKDEVRFRVALDGVFKNIIEIG